MPKKKPEVIAKASKPLEKVINNVFHKREEIRELTQQVDALKKVKAEMELALIKMMGEQLGDDAKASSSLATASVSTQQMGNAKDWDKIYAFMKRHNAFYLLERRIANAAYRELIGLPKHKRHGVSGIETFDKTTVKLLTLKA